MFKTGNDFPEGQTGSGAQNFRGEPSWREVTFPPCPSLHRPLDFLVLPSVSHTWDLLAPVQTWRACESLPASVQLHTSGHSCEVFTEHCSEVLFSSSPFPIFLNNRNLILMFKWQSALFKARFLRFANNQGTNGI